MSIQKVLNEDLFQSAFSHWYVFGETVCLFHSLTQQKLLCSREVLRLFRSFPRIQLDGRSFLPNKKKSTEVLHDRLSEMLVRLGLLVSSEADDRETLEYFDSLGRFDPDRDLQTLYLITSTTCNFACKYCFVMDGSEKFSKKKNVNYMTADLAVKAVDYFFHHSGNSDFKEINFYGGEPLLNIEALLAASDRAIQLAAAREETKLDLTVVTNGSGVTSMTAEALAERRFLVSLSLDGPKTVNDLNRLTHSGTGTYSVAFRAFNLLRDAGIEPNISCTLSTAVMDHWEETIEFFLSELSVGSIGFNILHEGRANGDEEPLISSDYDPTPFMLSAHDLLTENGVFEHRVGRRLLPFKDKHFHFRDCTAVGGGIAVRPDGTVGPCHGLQGEANQFPLSIHQHFDQPIYENELMAEWASRTPMRFDECLDCPAIAVCGGGCTMNAMKESGSMWAVDRRTCHHVKETHKHLNYKLVKADMLNAR